MLVANANDGGNDIVTCSADSAIQYERNILKASCSIDIITDVASE